MTDITAQQKIEKNNIPPGWQETTLGEVLTLNYGKGLVSKNRIDGDVPVYGSSGITGAHSKSLVEGPGLIIGRKGTVGSIYKSEVPFFPIDTVYYCTQNDSNLKLEFLYYFLQYLNLPSMNSDSAVPGLSRDRVYAEPIKIPSDAAEQKAIAGVLSSFDEKIELLRVQNETLEETAQMIFKEWFGKYSPDHPEDLPDGWRVGKLSDIANFLNGLALQKYPPKEDGEDLSVIKIRELKQGITLQTDSANSDLDEKYIIKNGDILFSWSGSLEVVIWKHGKGALNQHLFKVTSENYPKWFYYFWLLHHLREFRGVAANKATTMGHINRKHLDDALVVIPNDDFLEKGSDVIAPILKKIEDNDLQVQSLTKTRDTLLPKLMSGELMVE